MRAITAWQTGASALSLTVCGRWACSHESGIHMRGTLTEPLAFQPFDGKSAGRESTELLLGKHSGKSAVINALRGKGN
jgi:isopropylmalate/homocitrate/citramalate synthase